MSKIENNSSYPISISSKGVEIGGQTKKYIEDKIHKLDNLSLTITNVSVVISQEKTEHHVRLEIKNLNIYVDGNGESLHNAIDNAMTKFQRQLKACKEKMVKHQVKAEEVKKRNVLLQGEYDDCGDTF